jgi:transglutaminase-like putative cysteine protease
MSALTTKGVLSFKKFHKITTYLMATMGLGALCLGDLLGPGFKVFLLLAVIGSWFAEGARLQTKRYHQLWSALLIVIFVVQCLRGISGQSLLLVAVEFSAFLQISRLFNRHGAREAQQIIVLAFLHLIAATVLTTSLIYALIFIGFVVLTPWMLALSHIKHEAEKAYPLPEEQLQSQLDRSNIVNPKFLLGTATLAFPILLVTSLLFLAFPRVGLGLFSFGYSARQRTAGFGGQVDLGEFGAIREDPTVVLRVRIASEQLWLRPESLRLRGTSFDHYDGRRWERTNTELLPVEHVGKTYHVQRWPQPTDAQLPIELEPIDENVIFLPQGTVALEILPRIRIGVATYRHIIQSHDLEFRYLDATDQGLTYVAFVSAMARTVDNSMSSSEARARYLNLPSHHDRLIQLATQLTRRASTQAEKIAILTNYLRDNPQFHYTTNSETDPGSRPLEYFLFTSRSGHCEYFASALTMMLRAVNIPSRYVTGFLGGRYNPYGKYIAVRQGDAHSWVEAFVDGTGWVTLDPTPTGRASISVEAGISAQLRAVLDALRSRWDRHVVSYDLRHQLGLWHKLAQWAKHTMPSFKHKPATISPQLHRHSSSKLPGGYLVLGIGICMTGLLLYGFFKRRAKLIHESTHPSVTFYQEVERWLLKHDHPRPSHATPLEHAMLLKEKQFPAADTVYKLTDRYMLARYGHQLLTVKERKHLLSELHRSSRL